MSKKEYCLICKKEMNIPYRPDTRNCGGDCLRCMAESGDPDCIKQLKLIDHYNQKRKPTDR